MDGDTRFFVGLLLGVVALFVVGLAVRFTVDEANPPSGCDPYPAYTRVDGC